METNLLVPNIKKIFEIDIKGNHIQAMDCLYSFVYDILVKGEYNNCNLYIGYFLEKDFSLELQVALARITKPHKERLENRKKLMLKLEENLLKECPYVGIVTSILSSVG